MFSGCSKSRKEGTQLGIFTSMFGFLSGRLQLVSTAGILIFYTTFSLVLSQYISQGPANVIAIEGKSAFLSCYVTKTAPKTKWLRGEEVISVQTTVEQKLSDRFEVSVNSESDIDNYSLRINNIQRKDGNYKYSCAIYNGEQLIEISAATITVKEIPKARYPECTPIVGQITDGKPLTIICRSERTNPLPILRLIRNQDETIEYEAKNDSTYLEIEYRFMPSVSDETDKTTFMCIMETPAKRDFTRNCSFGPFNVMHKPEMTIKGTERVSKGKEVVYICQGKGNPSQIEYRWEFEPQLPEDTYKLESSNSILRLIPTYDMTSTKILCVGSNSIGESSTYLILNVTTMDENVSNHDLYAPASVRPSTGKETKNLTMATILSVAGTCLLVISVLAASTICYIYLCFRKNFHPLGYKIAQPDVYSEPRDSLPPPVLSTDRVARWQKRNVGVQVSLDYNISEEPLYSETPTAKLTTEAETETEILKEETPQNRSATYV